MKAKIELFKVAIVLFIFIVSIILFGCNASNKAQVIADFLKQQKVQPACTSTQGYGETQPVSANDQVNRRIEVAILTKPQNEKNLLKKVNYNEGI